MGKNSKIEWTDHTFNPWRGCQEVHTGCDNCYARTLARRNPAVLGVWGPNGTRVVASEAQWRQPLKWDREAAADGVRRRVFCASLADVFEDWRGPMVDSAGRTLYVHDCQPSPEPDRYVAMSADGPGALLEIERDNIEPGMVRLLTLDDVRVRLFWLIDATPNLDWIYVTKRPENVRRMWPKNGFPDAGVPGTLGKHRHFPNVWLLTSISDQKTADAMVPELLKCRDLCPVLGVSAEPLLGPVDLGEAIKCRCSESISECQYCDMCLDSVLDWVIIGGESGPDARCCDVEWIRDLVSQCKTACVPAFVKQLGSRQSTRLPDGERWPGHTGPVSPVQFCGDGFGNFSVLGLTDRKGGDPTEWPVGLRVRQFPEVRNA
ncbi:MAG: DUF5131 family protein [Caulobacteraceae bacterium]|nr:DUF5131 family protein [Caulobacteraceae bacterium]